MFPKNNWLNLTRLLFFKNKIQKDVSEYKNKEKKVLFISHQIYFLNSKGNMYTIYEAKQKKNQFLW